MNSKLRVNFIICFVCILCFSYCILKLNIKNAFSEITASDIKKYPLLYYGKYVNYGGTYKGGEEKTYKGVNWKIFNIGKDENGNDIIQLISDDYVDTNYLVDTEFITKGFSAGALSIYQCGLNCYSDRKDLLEYLTYTNNWECFKADGIDCTVKGGPTVEEFVNSYNTVRSKKQIEYYYTTDKNKYNAEGYLFDFKKDIHENNKANSYYLYGLNNGSHDLYYIKDTAKAYTYWLCGYSANDNDSLICGFHCAALDDYGCKFVSTGVRPLVSLTYTSKLKLEKNGTYSIE